MPRHLLCIVLGLLLLVGLGLLLDAAWLEPSSLRLSRYPVALNAPDLKGLKIAVISDLHAGSPYIDDKKLDRIVAMTNAAQPDLVLLTGDYVIDDVWGGRFMPIEEIAAHLRLLRARLGVYAVLGNHEHHNAPHHIAAVLRAHGIAVLENAHAILPKAGGPLYLAGIGDSHVHAASPGEALSRIPAGRPVLCFTHSPDIFPHLPKSCALTIAGHTHGGQVLLPLLGRPAVAAMGVSRYGQRYAIGQIREKEKTLFVSSGIGTSALPLRFGVPPEISLLIIE
ncbi:MAG TPA: metallophosphoesterase [Rhizomicrobium sp.]|nr:metallophosphoesterase [Rhizomicrobium sp.]